MSKPPKTDYQHACPSLIMNIVRHWRKSFSDRENHKVFADLPMQITEMFNIKTADLCRVPDSIPACTTGSNLALNYPSA